jgi:hypothetical protein
MHENRPISFLLKVKKVDGDGLEAVKAKFIKFLSSLILRTHHPDIERSLSFLRMEDLRTGSSGLQDTGSLR